MFLTERAQQVFLDALLHEKESQGTMGESQSIAHLEGSQSFIDHLAVLF